MSSKLIGVILIAIGVVSLFWTANSSKGSGAELFSFGTKHIAIEKSIDARELSSIGIFVGSPDVTVTRGGSEQIAVRLSGDIGKKRADEFQLHADSHGDTLRLNVELPSGFNWWAQSRNVNLNVELPDKIWDSVKIESGSGDIKAERIESRTLRVHTGSGNIDLDEYTVDNLTFRAGSGDVTLAQGKSAIDGETGSGNITIEAEQLRHDTNLKSGSGDVTIRLSDDPESLAIDFKAGSGEEQVKRSGMKTEAVNSERNGIKGKFGSGQTQLKVRTSSGDITLE